MNEKQKRSPKQELFAQTYVLTGNASEAYRTAYNVKTKSSNTISVQASKLLSSPNISLRIKEIQMKQEEKHDITKDKILNRLKEIIFNQEKLGVDKIDLPAMNKAIDTVNKMLGYYEADNSQKQAATTTQITFRRIDKTSSLSVKE